MANPACTNKNPDGVFIDVRLGDNEYAQAAVKQALDDAEKAGKGRPRAGDGTGTKAEFDRRAEVDLGNLEAASPELNSVVPFGWSKVEQYMIDQGWFKRDKAGDLQYGAAFKRFEGEMGYANAVMKLFLEGRANGIKQLADNFLMKVKNGESAVQEGLILAQQMQGMARFGAQIVGMDKELGGGLAQSGFIKDMPAGRFDVTGQVLGDAVDADKYEDIFKKIYGKLNSGDVQGGTADMLDLARKISFLENPHEISKQALGTKIAGNAWNEVWINGLLSAPLTFTTNAFSAAYAVARPMITYGAAKTFAISGNKVAEQVAAESAAAVTEIFSAFNDALALGVHAFKTESSLYSRGVQPKITANATNVLLEQAGREVRVEGEMAEFIDMVGRITRLPGRGMLGTDEFAQHLAYRGKVAGLAVRKAGRDGVDLTNQKLVRDYIEREMEQAFDLTNPDAIQRWKRSEAYNRSTGSNDLSYLTGVQGSGRTINDEAAESTFQERNWIADKVNGAINRFPPLKPFVPFVRTPLNIIKGGFVESTPVKAIWEAGGSLRDAALASPTERVMKLQQRLLQDPDESFRIAGQITLTTALGGAVWGMVMSGNMTGGGPGKWTVAAGPEGTKDPRQLRKAQQAWLAAGNVPYSLKVPGTDTWIPLDRFGEPFSITLRMIADLGMYSGYMQRDEQDQAFGAWVGIASSGLFNASFARGIYDLMGILRGENADYVLSQQARNYAATQLPFGSFLAYLDRLEDPYKGAYEETSLRDIFALHEDAFGRGLFGKLAAKIPGVEGSPQLIDQLTGKPVPIVPGTGPNGLNPFQQAIPLFPRNSKADDTWQTVMDVMGSYEEKSAPIDLTEGEQQQFNKLMSETVINGMTVSQAINRFRNRADAKEFIQKKGAVLSGKRFQVQLDFNNMLNEYKKRALLQLQMSNPSVLERTRLNDASDQFRKMNDLERAEAVSAEIDSLLQRARLGY